MFDSGNEGHASGQLCVGDQLVAVKLGTRICLVSPDDSRTELCLSEGMRVKVLEPIPARIVDTFSLSPGDKATFGKHGGGGSGFAFDCHLALTEVVLLEELGEDLYVEVLSIPGITPVEDEHVLETA